MTAVDVVSGAAANAALDARAAWVRRELLAPLAARLARSGYPTTFDDAFVAWLEGRLPTDGGDPAAYLDREVTPALAAALPATPGPLTVTVAKDQLKVSPTPDATKATRKSRPKAE